MKCIHIAVSTRSLFGRNCVSFYRSGLTSIWPIPYAPSTGGWILCWRNTTVVTRVMQSSSYELSSLVSDSGKCHHHRHHHVVLSARISLILYHHPSLSSIARGRSSRIHPISAQSCCMQIQAGRPAFARPCEGVHRSTSLTSSSLLLQLCPACLVRLILIVFVMDGRWPYSCCFVSCCFVSCCFHYLFNIARSILV